ncbi:hypothetical protein NQ317_014640 [Molorchus minor]|uniref:Fibronectin type-III domain-containing protein n=1 Tax=Molorchus minor TaxID=1323400 RepID=A0ABQ9JPL0_9CUCU|nr:hypothetical protein NQ317_014640 [Molorchus minor]
MPAVINLNYSVSTNRINLTWQKPKNSYCTITSYSINCKLVGSVNCPYKSATDYTRHSKDPSYELRDLKPYSIYEVIVAALGDIGSGEASAINVTTKAIETLSKNEIPQIIGKSINPWNVDVYLSQIRCEDIQGPIHLLFETQCLSQWCSAKDNRRTISYKYPQSYITLRSLIPYTNYSVVMKVSRHSDFKDYRSVSDNFTTNSSVPGNITDVLVTSRDEKIYIL